MKVWRIGSKWGEEDIFPVFKKHKIAFAGSAVDGFIKQVKAGDLVAITQGQQIIGVAKAAGLERLISHNLKYRSEYDDVLCIKLNNLYTSEDHPELDFGFYDGRGKQFHEAHHNYRKDIKSLFNRLTSINMQNDAIELLKHKKQIILQGPPGTGKTFLAEKMAKELTKEKILNNPVNLINQYFSTRQQASPEKLERRRLLAEYLSEFQEEFKKEDLHNLPIERYVSGRGDNTFCWWIEYGLFDLGGYTGQAAKFKLFWKKDINAYSKSGFIKDIEDDDQAMHMVAEQLQLAVDEVNLPSVADKLSSAFILKILHSYYPDRYFPINNEVCINNALKLLAIPYNNLNVFEKNRLLQQTFLNKKAEFNADVENHEFMRFLFGTFEMKGRISIDNNQVVTKGDYKIIQFHPAYSYEDFVRGITIETTDTAQVNYKSTNKVLVNFANAAIDNPSGNYVLIIDEINRANLPAVLGELIYALEYRGKHVESMYSMEDGSNQITLPDNLFIIGTMNTADRSVGHIDYAIRRRFAFLDILPTSLVIDEVVEEPIKIYAKNLFSKVSALFSGSNIASDFKPHDVQLGHSYFLAKTERELELKLKFEIKPLLQEYLKDGILQNSVKVNDQSFTAEDYIKNLHWN